MKRCGRCGQPPDGDAAIDGVPYCHPDDTELPDCYSLAQVALARPFDLDEFDRIIRTIDRILPTL